MAGARLFDGSSDYLDPSGYTVENYSSLSFGCWIKIAGSSNFSDRYIFGNATGFTFSGAWGIKCSFSNTGNLLTAVGFAYDPGGFGSGQVVSQDFSSLGDVGDKAVFIGITVSGTTFKFYGGVDDADNITLIASQSGTALGGNNCPRPFIGAKNGSGSASSFFPGVIDQVQVYRNQVLDLDAFKEMATCEQTATGFTPKAVWNITGTDSPELDTSGNGFDATVHGTTAADDLCSPPGDPVVEVDKVIQFIESTTEGVIVDKVIQFIEYVPVALHVEERFSLSEAADLSMNFNLVERFSLADQLTQFGHVVNLHVVERFTLTDGSDDNPQVTNVGKLVILTHVIVKPIKFTLNIVRKLFFGGE